MPDGVRSWRSRQWAAIGRRGCSISDRSTDGASCRTIRGACCVPCGIATPYWWHIAPTRWAFTTGKSTNCYRLPDRVSIAPRTGVTTTATGSTTADRVSALNRRPTTSCAWANGARDASWANGCAIPANASTASTYRAISTRKGADATPSSGDGCASVHWARTTLPTDRHSPCRSSISKPHRAPTS